MTGLSRRRLLGLGGGTVLAAGLGLAQLAPRPGSTGEQLVSALPLPEPFRVPLPVPRVLTPASSGPDGDSYEIVQRATTAELLPGVATPIWGYDGTFPGPTIESRRGRAVTIVHRNELPVPTVAHLHGGHTPAGSDGYPTDLVLPAAVPWEVTHGHHGTPDARAVVTTGTREYTYPLDQRAALLWYHDHRMDFTGPAVHNGLFGLHVVRDAEEDALPLPGGERELPLVLTDRAFAADGSMPYPALDRTLRTVPGVTDGFVEGVLGDVVLVNGAPWPVHEVSATRHRLRVLNGSNARRYTLALDPPPPDGPAFVQIGSDGGLLDAPRGHAEVTLAPAERLDLVVDFGRWPVGTEVTVRNLLGTGSTAQVMRFRIARAAREDSAVPDRLSTLEPPDPRGAVLTRDFSFRSGTVGGRHGWVIGGEAFSPEHAVATPRLGEAEIWRFVADLHHPVHVHLDGFRVLSRGGRAPGPLDGGIKDTVDLRPGEAVEVLVRFTAHAGRFVFHCHNLEHEDMGMMATFETVA